MRKSLAEEGGDDLMTALTDMISTLPEGLPSMIVAGGIAVFLVSSGISKVLDSLTRRTVALRTLPPARRPRKK